MKTISKYIDCIKTDIVFRIGQNAAENFDIIDASSQTDLWCHISDAPSCHVVASLSDHPYDKKQLHKIAIQGAMLCKQNSKFRSDKNVAVVYCRIADLEKLETVGSVHLHRSKTIVI